MEKRKWQIITIFLTLAIGLTVFLGRVAFAKQEGIEEKKGSTIVTKDQYKSLFLANSVVEVRKDINGDLFVCGGNITIQGDVSENLFVAGGVVRITGDVRQSIFAVGGVIEINSKIGQDVLVYGGTIRLQGDVGDDVRVVGEKIDISESKIKGDLFAGGDKVSIDKETTVYGDKKISQPTKEEVRQKYQKGVIKWLIGTITAMIGWTLVALVILKLAPVKTQRVFEYALSPKEALLSLIVGFFAFPITAVVVLLLLISRIGIPIALVTILLGVTITLVAWLFPVAGLAYKLLPQKIKSYVLAIIISIPMAVVVCRLPIIGWLIRVLFVMWGVGAIILVKFKQFVNQKTEAKVEVEKK